MPALTRRRIPNDHSEVWRIFYGDIPVGTIGIRSGVPVNVDQWGWSCGFSPGLNPGQHQDGSAASFDLARAAFEETWNALLPQILESAFDEYRRHRAFQSWKRRMWAEGKPIADPSARRRGRMLLRRAGRPADDVATHQRSAHRGDVRFEENKAGIHLTLRNQTRRRAVFYICSAVLFEQVARSAPA